MWKSINKRAKDWTIHLFNTDNCCGPSGDKVQIQREFPFLEDITSEPNVSASPGVASLLPTDADIKVLKTKESAHAFCQELLVLAGPSYSGRLWCVLELFVHLQMGKGVDDIELLLLIPLCFIFFVCCVYSGHTQLWRRWFFSHSNPYVVCLYRPAELRKTWKAQLDDVSARLAAMEDCRDDAARAWGQGGTLQLEWSASSAVAAESCFHISTFFSSFHARGSRSESSVFQSRSQGESPHQNSTPMSA